MDWHEAIRAGFPGPWEGEPAELRRDIEDELSDHLACAMTRELRRTEDAAEARRRVLERFGDPKRLAWRLWLDAMKETVMSQRVMMVCGVLMAAACVAATAFAWLSFQQSQEMNRAMLAELKGLASRPAFNVTGTDQAAAKIRAVEGSKDGKPVAGVEIWLTLVEGAKARVKGTTDGNGIARFGPVTPGQYDLNTWTVGGSNHRRRIELYGGEEVEELVVFPPGWQVARPKTEIRFKVNWPEDLAKEPLFVGCGFRSDPLSVEVDGKIWDAPSESAALNTQGAIATDFSRGGIEYREGRVLTLEQTVRWREGRYLLSNIEVYRYLSSADYEAKKKERAQALKPGTRWQTNPQVGRRRISTPKDAWFAQDKKPVFDVQSGSPNEWEIVVPPEVVEAVRKFLAEERDVVAVPGSRPAVPRGSTQPAVRSR